MKTFKISSLFIYIYLSVIISLLFLFFYDHEENSYNINGLSILEISSVEFPLLPKRIKSLDISFKGLSFYITKKTPVTVISDDDIKRFSNVENIIYMEDSVQVNLENEVSINFRVDNNEERLTISSNIPKVFPTIKELTIPYNLLGDYNVEKSELSYKISNRLNEFHLKLNDKYKIDNSKKIITLFAEDDKVSTLTFSPLSNQELPIAEQWYLKFRKQYEIPLDNYQEEFLTNIEQNISKTFTPIRYIKQSNQWENIPSLASFTENKVIVYLANAMNNNNYAKALQKVLGLKAKYPRIFGYQSSPYLGNIIVNGKNGALQDKKNLDEIQKQISNGDLKLFKNRIPEHYFIDNQINTTLLGDIINQSDKKLLTLQELSVSLYHLMQILESGNTNSENSNSIKDITDLIIAKIKWDDSGLYLIDESNLSSQVLNLKTGQLLITASQYETNEYSKSIGEALIYTALNSSDSNGNIPLSYNLANKSFSINKLNSEDLYLLLTKNPYTPHYYQKDNIKVWTISDSITIDKGSKNTKITISYPRDSSTNVNSHFLVISGIKPYTQLYFRGRPWRADSKFERYGVGYYYEQSTQILYFMPNHTQQREEIIINY